MYKTLVIGVTLIILWGSGFYIWKSGGGEMIRNAFFNNVEASRVPPTIESVSGIYACNIKTGCKNKYVIFLRDDLSVELLSSNEIKTNEEIAIEEAVQESSPTIEGVASTTEEGGRIERNSIIVNEVSPEQGTSLPPDMNTMQISTSTSEPTFQGTTTPELSSTTSTPEVNASLEVQNIEEKDSMFKNITSLNELLSATATATSEPSNNVLRGSWQLAQGGILILNFTQQGTTTFEVPKKFIIKNITASVLSRIDYSKIDYKDMEKPIFIKQD